jgi:hypothetical protein
MRADTFQSIQRTSSPGWYAAHLAEGEALALEHRGVGARQLLVRQPLRADLDAAQLLARSSGGSGFTPSSPGSSPFFLLRAPRVRDEAPRALALGRLSLHGTSTTSNTRRTICSEVTSSASAS